VKRGKGRRIRRKLPSRCSRNSHTQSSIKCDFRCLATIISSILFFSQINVLFLDLFSLLFFLLFQMCFYYVKSPRNKRGEIEHACQFSRSFYGGLPISTSIGFSYPNPIPIADRLLLCRRRKVVGAD